MKDCVADNQKEYKAPMLLIYSIHSRRSLLSTSQDTETTSSIDNWDNGGDI